MIALLLVAPAFAANACAFDATPDVEAGYAAYNIGDFATALRLLGRAAARGNSDALVGLNYMYVRGDGVAVDAIRAAEFAARAAAMGNPEGLMALGYKYWVGVGVARDLPRAVDYDCKAIALGDPRAMNNLAIMYQRGDYVPVDLVEARSLWRQSAERGHPNAEANLGLSYLRDADPDPGQARLWLRRAAQHGVERARAALAQLGEIIDQQPGVDGGDKLAIYPRDMRPGVSRVCGSAIS